MGCAFLLLRETRKTRRLYAKILDELKKPRPLHEADMQLIMKRIDDMDKRISDALDGLGSDVDALATATENETGKLASIETELRNATSLGDSATTEIANRIAAIRSRITSSTTRLTDSFSGVQDAVSGAGGSSGGSDQGGASQGSGGDQSQGSAGGGTSDGSQAAGSGSGIESGGVAGSAGSPTPTDQPAGASGEPQQGSDAPQDPPQG